MSLLLCHVYVPCYERKKHPKKICIKNFGRTLAGGSRRGLGAQILYVGVGFPSRIQRIKNFEGGGSKGVLGVGSKVQFWGPISLCLCAFLGLDLVCQEKGSAEIRGEFSRTQSRPSSSFPCCLGFSCFFG